MKKKTTSLMLNKKYISNLQVDQITGGVFGIVDTIGIGKTTKKCPISNNNLCDTDLCASHAPQTCTITYEECFTELRFCGTEC